MLWSREPVICAWDDPELLNPSGPLKKIMRLLHRHDLVLVPVEDEERGNNLLCRAGDILASRILKEKGPDLTVCAKEVPLIPPPYHMGFQGFNLFAELRRVGNSRHRHQGPDSLIAPGIQNGDGSPHA